DTVTVGEVMSPARVVAKPDQTVEDLRRQLERHRSHGAPVIDEAGELVGIATLADIGTADDSSTKVAEVMTRRPVTVSPDIRVSQAMERMAALGVGRLPVVAADDPTKLVGMFRREDAVRAYHQALGSRTDHHLVRRSEEHTSELQS